MSGQAQIPPVARKRVNLALQGGGAHGAFTWGVLDALLEDGRLEIEGLSGTSAGAMNAAIIACGIAEGGPEAARRKLARFWKAVAIDGDLRGPQRALFDALLGAWKLGSTGAADWLPQFGALSPYALNPLDINPLRDVVERHVDFERLRAYEALKLFIAATNVHTGKVRVFHRQELTADMLMASAALPSLFKAVEVEGVPYWDGGYMGNPVLFPFFTETGTADIILVQINPIMREETPNTSSEILERVNEITFNASLLHELRAIDFVRRLIDAGRLAGTHYKRIRMHRISAQDELRQFGSASKLSADWALFQQLHRIGRKAGQDFLRAHFDMIGVEGTLDLRAELA
ncbi:patatin [Alsobacter soli]|uniref:Patatin n=1 Tax=Alsobacter soli TaxID=2109933 RepID=A0A2T1HWD9_9HYPH|nr:patatin-like phospholipase family protein [Alsobacter soli]PSC05915.1 patatin [Alsobacter soli]